MIGSDRCFCPCPDQVGTYLDDKGHQHVISVACVFDGDSHAVKDYSDEGNWELVDTQRTFGAARESAIGYLNEQAAFYRPLAEIRGYRS